MPLGIAARFGAKSRAALGLGMALPAGTARADPIQGTPPYPPSPYITRLDLDWSRYRRDAVGSDNRPSTWAADGNVYAAWGGGFGPGAAEGERFTLAFTGQMVPQDSINLVSGGFVVNPAAR